MIIALIIQYTLGSKSHDDKGLLLDNISRQLNPISEKLT
jgi:hypothetical protein